MQFPRQHFQNLKPNRWNRAVSEVSSIYVGGELHAKVWDASAADWVLWSQGVVAWFRFDPVIGDALRPVGDGDRAALAESKGIECAPHRCVVLVGVAAQVVSVFGREAENCPRDPTPTHRSHAVNDVVVGIGMPRTIDLRVGVVWPGSERKDGERPGFIGHEKAVSVRDVLLSINPARVSVGPLCSIPIRLHERAGSRICALDKTEVFARGNSNLHAKIVATRLSVVPKMPTMWP